jgi:hypothetical protein
MEPVERVRLAADLRRAFPRNSQILAAANELERLSSVVSTPVASTHVDTTPVASTTGPMWAARAEVIPACGGGILRPTIHLTY